MEIPITKVVFDERERRMALGPLESGWVTQGPYVRRFEESFAEFTGARHAIATSSCTGALHLALRAAGIGAGDEVVVPAFSFVATANVVEATGARPIFVDVDLETFNLDAARLEDALSPRSRAVLLVHEFGLGANVAAVMAVAKHHGVEVIEDAACALGTRIEDRHAGRFGRAGCFSFHPRKTVTTGQGGMLITDDDVLAERVRTMRRHGMTVPYPLPEGVHDGFLVADCIEPGLNYQMSDLQGALGVAQMEKAASILERRAERAARYYELLADMPWLRMPHRPTNGVHAFQSFVCLFQPEAPSVARLPALRKRRGRTMQLLESAGVAVRQGALALPALSYYRDAYGLEAEDYPGALIADGLSLTLPLYAQMTDEEQDYVVTQLTAAYERL